METVSSESTAKSIGQVKLLTIDITKPMKMQGQHLDLNSFNLLLGKNGVGKSFMMKLIWALSSTACVIIIGKATGAATKIGLAQFYFDHTFFENNIDGTVGVEFDSGSSIEVKLTEGKVTHVNEQLDPELIPPAHPKYLSSNMRLMTEVTQYMKLKKALGIEAGIPRDEAQMLKLLDSYRLYDVMHAENILACISAGEGNTEFIDGINKNFSKFEDDNSFVIKGIKVDYERGDIKYLTKDELWLSMATMGAGHQAILNMFIIH